MIGYQRLRNKQDSMTEEAFNEKWDAWDQHYYKEKYTLYKTGQTNAFTRWRAENPEHRNKYDDFIKDYKKLLADGAYQRKLRTATVEAARNKNMRRY